MEKELNSLKEQIDNHVSELIDSIKLYNPLDMLYYLKSMEMIPTAADYDEGTLLIKQDPEQTSMIQYFTSLLTAINGNEYHNNEVSESIIFGFIDKYQNITSLMYQYFLLYSKSDEFKNSHSDMEIDYIYNRFIYSKVTGKRYQCFEKSFYKTMLTPHIEEINNIFELDKTLFFDGIDKIMEKSSGSTFLKGIDILKDVMEELEDYDIPLNEANDFFVSEETRSEITEAFSIEQYRINHEKIWNSSLLDAISLSLGDNTIFTNGNYSGWPINNTLHKYRPLLKVNDAYYCFDYYNFVDNFYRTIYKAIINKDKKYAQIWQTKQKEVTENKVGEIFKRIFPDAKIFRDNYYFVNGDKSCRSENDIIVLFDDIMFVIEVKAGNYTPDNPFVNFSSHRKTIVDLIEKPDEQCIAVLSYLEKYKQIYNEKNDVKCLIDVTKFNKIYCLSVTLENFNEISSVIEKFENINFTKGNFLISIDDLNIYADYFENYPYLFLDYLTFRSKGTNYKKLYVNDELDYLGLYLSYRDYNEEIEYKIKEENLEGITEVFFEDARLELDLYYDSKQTPKPLPKPKPDWIDKDMETLINLVIKSNHPNKKDLVSLLYEAAYQTNLLTDNYLRNLITRVKIAHKKIIDDMFVSTITINSSEISIVFPYDKLNKKIVEKAKIRSLAKLKLNHLNDSYILFIEINKKNIIQRIKIEYVESKDIQYRNQKKLDEIGKDLFNVRKINLMQKLNVKTYPDNDKCPCGSNKCYKECCKPKGL